MIKPMTYNGYTAKIEYDAECDCFLGEVLDLNDTITFSGTSSAELKQALKDSVDAYIEYCNEVGDAPEKPFSGKFSVRIEPALHKAVSRQATLTGKSINAFVSDALTVATEHRVTSRAPGVDLRQWASTGAQSQKQEQTIIQSQAIPYYSAQSEVGLQ
jgi:predicted HicB family RNase H-like nuclease